MNDNKKTKTQLIQELEDLRLRIAELEKSETERKRAEEALRESEELYRNVFKDHTAVKLLIDPDDGSIIEANEAAIQFYGWSHEQLRQMKIQEINTLSPEDVKKEMEDARSGKRRYFEFRHRRADGSIRDVEVFSSMIREKGKGLLQSDIYDISERKRAEKVLRESEERFRKVFDEGPIGMVLTSRDREFFRANPAFCQMLGYTSEEMSSKTFLDVTHPAHRDADEENVEKMWRNEIQHYRTEKRYLAKNSEIRWGTLSTSLIRGEDGEPLYALAMIEDITDRKRVEEELRSSKMRLSNAMEIAHLGHWELDLDTGLFTFSDQLYKIFRTTAEEVGGYTMSIEEYVRRFVHPDEIELVAEETRKAIETTDPDFNRQIEHRMVRADGTFGHIAVRFFVIKDSNGRTVRTFGVNQDITERKQAEEEKRNLEERLQRAEKMEALGLLAGGVAHDLNNMLGLVVGYAELLLNDLNESGPTRDSLLSIMDGGQRAAAIVQDLLNLTRRGVGGRKVLNLNRPILDLMKSAEWEKLLSYHPAVQIKTDLEPDLLNISGSSIHLEKTLFNLVSNACEAMPKGGVLIIKTTNRYLDKPIQGYDHIREGDYVVLSVSDTGEGISAADLKRIFEPFYTKKIMGRSGTGLGLAVVWGTVKDHHGYIDVQSEEGKGTCCTLYFPVAREEITAEASSVLLAEYLGRGESVLVVDDIKGQRDLAAAMLKKLNYRVASVSSGEAAIEYLREREADLLVLDMIMDPGLDGLDTYKRILEIHPKQKAIIVSGFSESDRVESAQSLGAGAYVRKPYVIEKLGLAVRKELDKT